MNLFVYGPNEEIGKGTGVLRTVFNSTFTTDPILLRSLYSGIVRIESPLPFPQIEVRVGTTTVFCSRGIEVVEEGGGKVY